MSYLCTQLFCLLVLCASQCEVQSNAEAPDYQYKLLRNLKRRGRAKSDNLIISILSITCISQCDSLSADFGDLTFPTRSTWLLILTCAFLANKMIWAMVHTQLSHLLALPLKDRLWIKKLLIIIVTCTTYTQLTCLCSRVRNPHEGLTTLKLCEGGWQSLNEHGQELVKPQRESLTKLRQFLKNIPLKGRRIIRCKVWWPSYNKGMLT